MSQQVDHERVERDIAKLTKEELKAVIHQLAGEVINRAQEVQEPENVEPYSGTRIGFIQS